MTKVKEQITQINKQLKTLDKNDELRILNNRIENLDRKLDTILEYLTYQPGSPLFQEAKEHFESLRSP